MKNVKYISASAGSGKTHTLTETLMKVIKNGDVEPEKVILTTFTKAAASEFKEKAKAMLYENGMILEADRLDQALIGTIHSVAESFIQKYWYVLGLSPKINPIAEEDLDFFKNQSLVNLLTEEELNFLNKFAEEFEIKVSRSTKFDYEFWKNDLSKILEYTKNYRIENYESSIACSKELTSSLVQGGHHIRVDTDALESILDKAERLNNADDSDDQTNLRIAINFQRRMLHQRNPSSIKYAQEVLGFVHKLPWAEIQEDVESFKDNLNNLYASEEVRELLNKYIDVLFSLAERWNSQYENYKKENHLIDFSDMEVYFLKLLGNKEVAADIKATYKYVFVDEFQDCSPMQVMIFDELSKIVEHNIWVGDKKQAIYGFRGSDTELTTFVMDKIKSKEENNQDGCTTDILHNSWRSLPNLVKFTNKVFTRGFSDQNENTISLAPQRKGNGLVGYYWLTGKNQGDRAKTLALNIVELINNGENPSDIAVLARTKDHLKGLADTLRELKVPVYIDEGGQSGTDTVNLVLSILQLIADETAELPKAQIAFLTEDNYKLGKILDDKFECNRKGKEYKEFYNDIPLVKKVLEERNRYKLQSVAALVESLIIELDLYNEAKKLNDAADTTKILHAIIDSAYTYEDYCKLMHLPSSVSGFISYLSENDISVSGSTEGVQFYTFHRSKGLEWKTVILLDCDKDILEQKALIKRNIFGTQLIRVNRSTDEELIPEVKISVVPNLFSGNSRIADEWLSLINASERYGYVINREKEEAKRLMYVAMTRPRDNLIFALNGSGKNPKPLVTFKEMGFNVETDFSNHLTDLFGAGVFAEKLGNAEADIKYECEEEKNEILCLAGKSDKEALVRDLQPSSIPGGDVKSELFDNLAGIPVEGKYNSADLGTCIHNIFCVADKKSEREISEMIKAYGFEKNLPDGKKILESWSSLIKFLSTEFGDGKSYHELPFKYQLGTKQIVTGSMDFVWETEKGCVVVDFKTFPGKKEDLLDKDSDYYAGKYKGQLECYEHALLAAGKKVIARMLFYPVLGVIVSIS